jgi:hypothetical protein
MCCKLLSVPAAGKPEHDWCKHCRPGHGCKIYDTRPEECAHYGCLWLIRPDWGDEWFPAKAKIIADLYKHKDDGNTYCRFHIDPAFPNRWREEPYYSWIKRGALAGLQGTLFDGQPFLTVVSLRGKWTLILPHRETAYERGAILRFGECHFEYFKCQDEAATEVFLRQLDPRKRRCPASRGETSAVGGLRRVGVPGESMGGQPWTGGSFACLWPLFGRGRMNQTAILCLAGNSLPRKFAGPLWPNFSSAGEAEDFGCEKAK